MINLALDRGPSRRIEGRSGRCGFGRVAEGRDVYVGPIPASKRCSRLSDGRPVWIYPLADWSVVLNQGIRSGTYPELVDLLF